MGQLVWPASAPLAVLSISLLGGFCVLLLPSGCTGGLLSGGSYNRETSSWLRKGGIPLRDHILHVQPTRANMRLQTLIPHFALQRFPRRTLLLSRGVEVRGTEFQLTTFFPPSWNTRKQPNEGEGRYESGGGQPLWPHS